MAAAAKERFGPDRHPRVQRSGSRGTSCFLRMTEADWDTVIDTNLKGAFLCAKAVAPGMIKQRSGFIVNVGSVIGKNGGAGQANYSASKAGLVGLTKSLAKELGSRNVRVNAVAPGFVETEMTETLKTEYREAILKHTRLDGWHERGCGGRRGIPVLTGFRVHPGRGNLHGWRTIHVSDNEQESFLNDDIRARTQDFG